MSSLVDSAAEANGADCGAIGKEDRTDDGEGLRMIEFFSGIGGMRLAVTNALDQIHNSSIDAAQRRRLQYCQAYDISIHANRTYKHNFADDDNDNKNSGVVSTKLVEQLKSKDLNGKADLWTMSPPCQPFTTTRGAKGLDLDDKRCNGLKAILRLLLEISEKPKYILLENVKGFATSQMIQEVYKCLKENGYTWKEYLLSPIHFGIPNHRQRYYLLCESSERWANGHSPRSPQSIWNTQDSSLPKRKVCDYLNLSHHASTMTDVVDNDDALIVPMSVLEQPWAKHLGIVTAHDIETHCFTAGYGRIFHKATGSLLLATPGRNAKDDEDEKAVATMDLDRSDMTQYHGRLRRFSPRELLNLFGFPPNFGFPGDISLEHRYKLVGNSINVTVVTELVKELLSPSPNEESSTKDIGQMPSMTVGGTKGHQEEEIHGTLLKLYHAYRWKMIPNCTGRHTCRDHKLVTTLPPLKMLERVGITQTDGGDGHALREYFFVLPGRKDPITVVPLDDNKTTGVITFVKSDQNDDDDTEKEHADNKRYVHTLNTVSGFRRKLRAIGIQVSESDIIYVTDSQKDAINDP